MKESIFANEFKNACKDICFFYKIPDSYGNERFTPKKPFDCFMLDNGNFHAIEFKMQKSQGAFAFDKVRPHQIEGLQETIKAGAKTADIVINFRWKKHNKTYAIPISMFLSLRRAYSKAGRKSIPYSAIEKLIEIKRIKKEKWVWDIESYLK